jgi:hypothetical protein
MNFPLQGAFVIIIETVIRLFDVVADSVFLLPGAIQKRIMIVVMMHIVYLYYVLKKEKKMKVNCSIPDEATMKCLNGLRLERHHTQSKECRWIPRFYQYRNW